MQLKLGKYIVTTESLNSLIVISNLILDAIERGIEIVKDLIPDDCEVEETKEELKTK